jgi:hypothetical protein
LALAVVKTIKDIFKKLEKAPIIINHYWRFKTLRHKSQHMALGQLPK